MALQAVRSDHVESWLIQEGDFVNFQRSKPTLKQCDWGEVTHVAHGFDLAGNLTNAQITYLQLGKKDNNLYPQSKTLSKNTKVFRISSDKLVESEIVVKDLEDATLYK